MENKELYQNWDIIKEQLKQRFSSLTESDVLLVNGYQDDLMGRLEMKLSKTKAEIEALVAEIKNKQDKKNKKNNTKT
ncbi:MAG: general stress protein CsbD [Flavobacteriales bacterium CG_4_9_14_3_um_filter_40_17]|nr:MAG: general stress protein CsbD [Flavobacteriales bacterium CG_4_9_14_3_um_filter_40_17]